MSHGNNGVTTGGHVRPLMEEELRKIYFEKAYKIHGVGTSIGINQQKSDTPFFVSVREGNRIVKQGWGKSWEEALNNVAPLQKSKW